MSFYSILAIGSGGFIGAVLRVFMIGFINRILPHTLPFGTICVNIFGGFLIGFILTLPFTLNLHFRSFLIAGVLGGFTTFSTFTFENFLLFEGGSFVLGALNIILSVFLALLFCYFGVILARLI